MFLGPETSQETLKKPKSRPRSTQRAPKARKKSTMKNKKNAAVVKNALRWRFHFSDFLGIFFAPKIAHVLNDFYTIC